ncbi:Thiamine transporter [Streptococcus agalactiae]|nr:Thiamine transporter [Streptococcus agalactiae]EJZ02677.1 hypothetical protein M3M_08507 [Streptococcus agalactiae STIR-CD-17]EPU01779.1 hypothetical protein SAG0122_00635 [Streptococcus agalactiae STIR-CD-09]EPU05833.1 hypothetical protein SAG0123_06890 [Streptococcus agalactiae STIR-CD-13]EPW83723.1 hypothetical protein SAG0121_04355 [Streptococcus agalactiae STIR-CD-07]
MTKESPLLYKKRRFFISKNNNTTCLIETAIFAALAMALSLALSGAILATFVRYVWHYIAGVIFWASYAPKGMSATLYSLSVNGTAGLLTLFFVVISIIILVISYPSFFLPKK